MGKRSRQGKKKAAPRKDSNRTDASRVSAALSRSGFWVLVFVLTVGVTQIGSLEREVIDWDESTFILMAANVLDGHLPYVELFEIKPPMLFFMLAGVMAVFGESLLVVRLFGDVCILASCLAVFAIARRWTDPISAGLGTLTFIAISSVYSFGQHTSSELPATAMLMAALWLLLAWRDRMWGVACAGLLVSLATLTRSNLGVAAVAFAGWLLVAYVRPSFGAHRWAFAAFVGAGAIPPGLLVLLYWAADALFELRVSIIDAPLAYAGHQLSVLEALAQHTDLWWGMAKIDPYLIGTWTVLTAGVLTWVSIRVLRERAGSESPRSGASEGLLWVTFAAVLFSIMVGGAAYEHYWLQLFPLYGVFCARAFGWAHSWIALRRLGYALVLVCVASALWNTVPSAARLIVDPDHLSKSHYIRHAARLIAADRHPDDTVWAFYDLPILWYLNEKPISKMLLPANLLRKHAIMVPLARSGYIASDELYRIMDTRPTYLVTGRENTLFYHIMIGAIREDPTVRKDVEALFTFINDHYSVFHEGGLLRVYKLRSKGDPTR